MLVDYALGLMLLHWPFQVLQRTVFRVVSDSGSVSHIDRNILMQHVLRRFRFGIEACLDCLNECSHSLQIENGL